MNELMCDLVETMSVPEVPYWAQLAAMISMNGMKIIPIIFWDDVAQKLKKINDNDEDYWNELKKAGFEVYSNHSRSEPHDYWHTTLAKNNHGAWVVPVDELLCVAYDDTYAVDFASIVRAVFKGTEEELVEAIVKFCND